MTQEQRLLVLPLEGYFTKEGKNKPVIDFKIKGGKIDVINYHINDKVFDIAECKIANNPVRIGQTFGQVLAYSSIIKDDGWRFFEAVLNKARNWLTAKELNKIFTERKVNIRLWVCFTHKGVSNKDNILSDLRNKINESVGIILVDKGNVKVTHGADELTVSIRPSYTKTDFYEKLREDIKDKFPRIRENGRRYPNVARFNFVHPSIHFEVWIKRREKRDGAVPIEIGLHLECNTGRDRYIFKELQKRKNRIKKKLPNVEFGRWGNRVEWYRVYERYRYTGDTNRVDERTLKMIEGKLLRYIKTLKPILEEIDWGRRRGIKKAK
jgi:hypothetical protein